MSEEYDDYIEPKTGDNVYLGLGNNNATLCDTFAEFIDNALAARDKFVDINIRIEVSITDKNKSKITISDNASGMSRYMLEKGLSLGEIPEVAELNEHGFGLKNGIFTLGKSAIITTKTKDDELARRCVLTHRLQKIGVKNIKVDFKHGTIIEITNLNEERISFRKEDYKQTKNLLGAKYRYYLAGRDCINKNYQDWIPPYLPYIDSVTRISFSFINLDDTTKNCTELLEPRFPVYYHPSTKENKPYIEKKIITGDRGDWEACLTLGYAPSQYAAKKRGITFTKKDPYGVRSGIDISIHNRIIKTAEPEEIGVKAQEIGGSWLRRRGEIHCLRGFKTTINKNGIVDDKHWKELKDKVKTYLTDTDYYKFQMKDTPEQEICDKIKNIMASMPGITKVEKGYNCGDPSYPVDISVTFNNDKKYAYEIKTGCIGMLEVLQLFGYMRLDKSYNEGCIIGKSLTPEGTKMINALKEDNYNINFIELSKFCQD